MVKLSKAHVTGGYPKLHGIGWIIEHNKTSVAQLEQNNRTRTIWIAIDEQWRIVLAAPLQLASNVGLRVCQHDMTNRIADKHIGSEHPRRQMNRLRMKFKLRRVCQFAINSED